MTAMLDTFVPPPRTGPDGRHRLLLAGATTLDDHVRRHGGLPTTGGRQIRSVVAESGLTGRGGAGFPTHRKLDAVASGRRAVAIGNGAEGEPASRKDRALLGHAPHLVLDGLQLAARAIDAREAHLYVPSGSAAAVRAALAARRDPLPVTVHVAPDAFVAGEESAVVSAVGGGPAIPQDKSVRVIERGLRGRPTLVQNVETLAHLALIVRYGADWFRRAGTADEPGTFLATLTGPVRTPGRLRVPVRHPGRRRDRGGRRCDRTVAGIARRRLPRRLGPGPAGCRDQSRRARPATTRRPAPESWCRSRPGRVDSSRPRTWWRTWPGSAPGNVGHASTGCLGSPTRSPRSRSAAPIPTSCRRWIG